MIKAIIFDWGGVLIDETLGKMDEYCAGILGVEVIDYNNARQKGFDDFTLGNISEDEFWRVVCDELGVGLPSADSLWSDTVEKVFNEKADMFVLIDKLKKSDYKIGFLSNTEMPSIEYWHNNDYARYFDGVVFSCVEHIAKPDRKIYELICKRLNVLPEESVFIDDKSKFIKGAKDAGMGGIVFESVEQVKRKLQEFL